MAALDPSEALLSANGWPDPREAAAQPQADSYEPDLALTPPYTSLDTMETATIYPGETSRNSNGVHSSVTLTLPVVTATSFEQQPINQLSGTTWPERIASFSVSQESSYINSNACNEVHEDTGLTSRPIIEEAQRNRPSVIVAARSRKRAIEDETNNKDAAEELSDADVNAVVLGEQEVVGQASLDEACISWIFGYLDDGYLDIWKMKQDKEKETTAHGHVATLSTEERVRGIKKEITLDED